MHVGLKKQAERLVQRSPGSHVRERRVFVFMYVFMMPVSLPLFPLHVYSVFLVALASKEHIIPRAME